VTSPGTDPEGSLGATFGKAYEIQFPDGSRQEFTETTNYFTVPPIPQPYLLTQIIDPAGNTVTLNYSGGIAVASIVDALGQTNTLLYTNTSLPGAITGIIDPFGRTATFQYNTNGQLSQITDVLGITSQYIYGSNDFVSALVTPYGTTTFSNSNTNGITTLQATDPLG